MINRISRRYVGYTFVIDGYSKNELSENNDDLEIIKDENFVFEVLGHIDSGINITSTVGKSFSYKLNELNGAQLVVGPIGSGGVLSNWLLNISAICFGPESYYSWTARDSDSLVWKPREPIVYYPINRIRFYENGNYSINMDILFEMIVEILNSKITKPDKI